MLFLKKVIDLWPRILKKTPRALNSREITIFERSLQNMIYKINIIGVFYVIVLIRLESTLKSSTIFSDYRVKRI